VAADERFQITERIGIVWRDYKAELVPVMPATSLEGLAIGQIGVCAIQLPAPTVAGDAVAFYVAQVLLGGTHTRLLQHHQPRFDDDAPGLRTQMAAGEA
jgi:hypothetical protein